MLLKLCSLGAAASAVKGTVLLPDALACMQAQRMLTCRHLRLRVHRQVAGEGARCGLGGGPGRSWVRSEPVQGGGTRDLRSLGVRGCRRDALPLVALLWASRRAACTALILRMNISNA